ncbi:hypothetical protein [Modestobacter italicus]|uniref:hypothetical protein n=1 Tax=Modestobacter italicus (strain DSM 44449 / CECT 9708 / BC 501) TaxID=2732864 RepID=UPI001C95AA04|nr:hypothetical protein [Modestobacter italicus]
MSAPALDPTRTAPRPAGGRAVALFAGLAALAMAPYLAGVLVPYYVNDLDALPLAELTSGAHDPKDLWPQGPLSGLVQLGGLLSLALTPMGLVAVLAGTLHRVASRGHLDAPAVMVGLLLVALACLAGLVLVFSPLGGALATWRLD